MFDPDVLTIAFARRFATYKRPNLLLHDPQRLLRILTNTQRPVQLIMAGKAHPADEPGQALIRQWIQFIRNTEARRHVIFLSDYDMLLTERLVQGADVWLNTPRRPWEASGTSGMKVLVNGGINLSELDGWWAEAYTPEVGWALGDGREHGDDPQWDAAEAEALYQLLEQRGDTAVLYPRWARVFRWPGSSGCVPAWRSSPGSSPRAAPFANTPRSSIFPARRATPSGLPTKAPWASRSRRWRRELDEKVVLVPLR